MTDSERIEILTGALAIALYKLGGSMECHTEDCLYAADSNVVWQDIPNGVLRNMVFRLEKKKKAESVIEVKV